MSELAYLDVRPVLAKLADLDRELVLVGGQAVNFWAAYYAHRSAELTNEAPFTSKDIDFCGDHRAVRVCAERLGGKARLATIDDMTPNTGTVIFVDEEGVTRTLDIVSAPFGLDGKEVRETALPVDILDDSGGETGAMFYILHPVLSMESRVHNVAGLAASYDNEQGRKQLRASILCAREFLRDLLEERMGAEDPPRALMKLNERIFRFCMSSDHAKELYRTGRADPADALFTDVRLPAAFMEKRLPQMMALLAGRKRSSARP